MVHKPIPTPKAITITELKAALDQELTKITETSGLGRVQSDQ